MEKYEETFLDLKIRGFDVFSMDWRGQGLSGRMLANPEKGFVRTFDDYIRDLDCFMETVVRPVARPPLVFLGHSLGGHVALRYLHDHPCAVDKAVFTAPMVDIKTGNFPVWLARGIAFPAARSGLGHIYALGQGGYRPNTLEKFRNNRLTSDFRRYMIERQCIDRNPGLALGGVTFGWLQAAFDSIDILRCSEYIRHITTPVLVLGAGKDQVVSNRALRQMCCRLSRCRLVMIPGSRHEILQENNRIRDIFWQEFDRFVSGGMSVR